MNEMKHQSNSNHVMRPNVYCKICYATLKKNPAICRACMHSDDKLTLPHFLEGFVGGHQKKIKEIQALYREREACFSKIHFTGPVNHLLNNLLSDKKFDSALRAYKTLFGEIYTNPLLLSPIFYDNVLEYQMTKDTIGILVQSVIPNAFNLTHDHILTQIICDVIRYEFHHTYDLTTFLRENSPATKLFAAYLNREPIRRFVDRIVEEACQPILDDYKECVDIDPSHIEGDDVSKTIEDRKEKLMKYVDFILSKILNADPYPTSLRIICQTLSDLAGLKGEQNHMQLRNAFIGGFIFLRIFNAKIACYGFVSSMKPPYRQCAKIVRRKFTLISKILQNIANQIESGMKEEWMNVMDPYIFSKFEPVHEFLNELCDIPSLESYHALHEKMLHDVRQNESLYISMDDLMILTTGISNEYNQRLKNDKLVMDDTNRRFYGAVSDIMDMKQFLHECQRKYTAHFAKIPVAKQDTTQTTRKTVHTQLEKELRAKVIPVLCKISDSKDVQQKYEETKHLMTDIIGIIQYVKSTKSALKKRKLKKALDVLKKKENPEIVMQILLKLYKEYVITINVYNRLCHEKDEMTLYISGNP